LLKNKNTHTLVINHSVLRKSTLQGTTVGSDRIKTIKKYNREIDFLQHILPSCMQPFVLHSCMPCILKSHKIWAWLCPRRVLKVLQRDCVSCLRWVHLGRQNSSAVSH